MPIPSHTLGRYRHPIETVSAPSVFPSSAYLVLIRNQQVTPLGTGKNSRRLCAAPLSPLFHIAFPFDTPPLELESQKHGPEAR